MDTTATTLHSAFQQFLRYTVEKIEPLDLQLAALEWRLSCYRTGLTYARYIEETFFPLCGKHVLDVACGWGGHALACAARGATATAVDTNDHRFSQLQRSVCKTDGVTFQCLQSDCASLPFQDESVDVILALDLIEHIPMVEPFCMEVQRLLRPGGICLLTTPARVRSILLGEPHWGLRGLAVLPLAWQRPVATTWFNRRYPYPIFKQYLLASSVLAAFPRLNGAPAHHGRLRHTPHWLRWITQQLLWDYLVLTKRK